MGVPYEFREAGEIQGVEWGATGSHGVPPGTWSDDGATMLGLLDALLPDPMVDPPRPGGYDLRAQADNFLAWGRQGAFTPDGVVFSMGGATIAALVRLGRGAPPTDSGGTDERSLGNGSLMRSVAIALWGRELGTEELVDRARESSAITHAHPVARETCALYVLICRELLGGAEPGQALARATEMLRAHQAETKDSEAQAALERLLAWEGRSGRGLVIDSFWSAWDAFAGAKDYRETVERAIRYGRDTDTTACIAGGLAGIHWGTDGIPAEWLDGMRGREVVGPIVDRLIGSAGWSTSYGSPLRVNWVDPGAVPADAGWTGRLGMTFLPGKQLPDAWGGPTWRDLATDARALKERHRVDCLLLLVEDHELESFRAARIEAALGQAGVELLRHPIRDTGVPGDAATFGELLAAVAHRLRTGQSVAVACRGGLGRTGTAVACLLIDAGLTPVEAIRLTRESRPRTIENAEQEAFVRGWSSLRRGL